MKRMINLYFFMVVFSIAGIAGIFIVNSIDHLRTSSRGAVAMDTVMRITASSTHRQGEIDMILEDAFNLIKKLEKLLSAHTDTSDVLAIGDAAGRERVSVARETYEALASALQGARLSDGAFDPTIGPVTSLWREKISENEIPSDAEIRAAASKVNFGALSVYAPDMAYLSTPEGKIDLGGVAKGYASAKVRDMLRERGVTSALIDLGGNVVTMGGRPESGKAGRQPWRVGVQDPSKSRGTPICVVELDEGAVVTAGVYERFHEVDGHRYTHIFNPATGRPVEGPLKSVTVVSNDPAQADALSTAFMVMGIERSFGLLRFIPACEAIFVSENEGEYEITATGGLVGIAAPLPGCPEITFRDLW